MAIIALIIILGLGFFLYNKSQTSKNQAMEAAQNQAALESSAAPSDGSAMELEESSESADTLKELKINLAEQNASGETGTVELEEENGKVTVSINVTGAPKGAIQPAHIHLGACPTPGEIKYPLSNIIDGKSETALDVDMKTLMSQLPLAINLHKSAEEIKSYVSCGNIKTQIPS